MKIAQELFDKYEILAPSEENSDVFDQHTDCVDYDGFFKALADYKQSIIELIEDIQTIELLRGWKHTSDILEELIAKIKEVK